MIPIAVVCFALLVFWLVLEFRTKRPDGFLEKIHPYRRLMFYIMPSRNESVVYFDASVDSEKLEAYVAQVKERFGANMTHVMVAAAQIALAATARMNRFVVGRRLYRRKGRWITFAMKRKRLDRESALATVKLQMFDKETFADLCSRVNNQIGENRSGKKTASDKEMDLFNLLPRPLLDAGVKLFRWADHYSLLPAKFIEMDPMYTSVFLANLGSLDMDPGYHHLYEYGTCPLFVTVGRIEEVAVVVDSKIIVRRQIRIRFSYDERVDDGLNARFGIEAMLRVLQQPERWLGCLEQDSSQHKPMWPRSDWNDESGKYMER